MKGKNKYIVPLLLAGLTTATGVVTTINQQQQTVINAETSTTDIENVAGVGISLKSGFDDIYPLGSTITMPEVEVDTTVENVIYTITRGTKEVKVLKRSEGNLSFKPDYTGAYKVTITAVKGNTVVTKLEGLTIMVEKSEAVINLPVNSKYVIPAKIPTGISTFKIPSPEVELVNAVDVEGEKANGELKVTLITPNGEVALTETATDTSNPYYPVESSDLEEAGTYQIRYEYYEYGKIVTRLETNFQVVDDLDMSDTKLYMKLQSSITSTGNVNTDISVPKVTVLDSETATDGINAHVTITYSKINDDGTFSEPQEIDYENYTFHPTEEGNYILSYKADLAELYGSSVSSDLYKPNTIIKVTDSKEPSVRPTDEYNVDVNDDGSYIPSIDGQEITSENYDDLLANRKTEVPSVAVVDATTGKAKITLPAIYAIDNFSDWEDITFTREIVGNDIAKKTFTSTLDADCKYPANKAISSVYEVVDGEEVEKDLTLGVGTYEIRYKATDAKGKYQTMSYSLVVKAADDVADAETEVKLTIGVSSITTKETLTFNVPTAKDTYDSYVDVVTTYELCNASQKAIGNAVPLTETNDDGKYELDIADAIKGENEVAYIKVTAKAIVDYYGSSRTFKEGELEETKYIKIIDVANDNNAPTLSIANQADTDAGAWNAALFGLESNSSKIITTDGENDIVVTGIDEAGYALGYVKVEGSETTPSSDRLTTSAGGELAVFDQGKEIIEIPAVQFTDEDENLKIKLTITDRLGNVVTKTDYESVTKKQATDGTDNWIYTVSGASFKLSASGVYTVTFRAEDVTGKVTVKSYGIRVNNRTAPTIVIEDEDKFGVDVEVGEFFEVPAGNLIVDGVVQTDRTVEWQVYGGEYERTSTGFYALSSGTYYVKYYGSDDMNNMQMLQDDSLFYINAKDTTAPVFNEDSSVTIAPTMAWNPVENESTNVKEMKIDIPVIYATDPIRNESIDVTCTVTGPDGSSVKIESDDDTDDKDYFRATKQGVYTIKYEATDSAKNTVSMTKELKLGDCVAPTLVWADEEGTIPETVELNGTFTLNLGSDNLTLSDNVSSADYLAENIKIKLIKPDGTTEVTNNGSAGKNYIWKLTETGDYTLSIIVTDEAGMSETYKYTINVPAEDTEEKTISPVVGTVLVVVSVVILAGVVIYFVVSSRKKATAKPARTRKKK